MSRMITKNMNWILILKQKLKNKIKLLYNLYDINDLQIGGHCGCCGNYISNEIFEKNWSWGICKNCSDKKGENMSKTTITKKFICKKCKKEIIIDGTEDQWATYKQGRVIIQRIFPEVPPDNREILQTGQCGECFDKMFPPEYDE